MRKLLCLLMILALAPLCAAAEESAAPLTLDGDWYAATLYTQSSFSLTGKPAQASDIPDMLLSLTGMSAPTFRPLAENAVLLCERGATAALALARKDGYAWKCYYTLGTSLLTFADGRVTDAVGRTTDVAWDGETLAMTYQGEALSGNVTRYGEDAIELRYTDEERVTYVGSGVPSLLLVRREAVDGAARAPEDRDTSAFSFEGDWWAEMLFPGYYLEMPAWLSSLMDVTNPAEDDAGPNRMTIGNQTVLRLDKGMAVGCVVEDGEPPFIALMRRESGGWNSYFNERIYSYRFAGDMFIDLDINGWVTWTLEGDVLTLGMLSGDVSGRIVVYNDDVFMWYNEDRAYEEDGVNYGVPWMLFVRQSAFR